ncbi:hypothetical protein [Thalassotalea mangrovi]|uniref:Uncharacterized protein n=1 Tax=Thalassotalea mangrovi TaxID=2572245 RepID=A0A4U1BAI1_9GAMM|nr:hypothetical protein [Thalassotalea mangrovi]TKB47843.1 hypothetical protein E8M12_00090 [Thalassotalea mangrovi]
MNNNNDAVMLPLWKRFLITLVVMLVVSFIIGLLVRNALGFNLPDYVSGVIGGLSSIVTWEVLKRVRPKT